jgi:uncharacterized YigZ family protein
MDYFFSINEDRHIEIKIKRSTFIAHLHYTETMQEAKQFISKISVEHKTANHNCWAYIVGETGQTFHSSDAGEPGSTAGKPMLNALKRHKMTNVVAVVTRYFGGVKLGIRGLIEAYGESVEGAIQEFSLKKIVKYENFKISTGYDFAEILKHKVNSMNAEILNIDYAIDVTLQIRIEECLKDDLENYLNEMENASKIKKLQCEE